MTATSPEQSKTENRTLIDKKVINIVEFLDPCRDSNALQGSRVVNCLCILEDERLYPYGLQSISDHVHADLLEPSLLYA